MNYKTEWTTYKIIEIALKMADAPFGSNLKSKDYTEVGIPVIQGKNINGRTCDWSDNRFVSKQKFNSLPRHHAKLGGLVFPKVGTIGKVGILTSQNNGKEYLLSTNTMMLVVNPEIADQDFVYYFFSSKKISNYILSISSNSVQPVFNYTSLKNFEISLPPLPTQRRIASILSAFDDKIELNRRINRMLEEMAQALFREYFIENIEGELVMVEEYIEFNGVVA